MNPNRNARSLMADLARMGFRRIATAYAHHSATYAHRVAPGAPLVIGTAITPTGAGRVRDDAAAILRTHERPSPASLATRRR